MAQRTTSTHRTSFARDTFQFHIVGYSTGGVASSVRSSAFHVGGHTWALVFGFNGHEQITSISLELLSTDVTKDVVAMASVRIDDPQGQRPPAVWRSEVANVFEAWPTTSAMATCRSWKLSLPGAFCGEEASYVKDDGLMIQCGVDVLVDEDSTPAAPDSVVSVVPPPSISRDLHSLLLPEELDSEQSRRRCLRPDVTFLVEETEIRAHKLVLAMRSPVLAAEFHGDEKKSIMIKVDDMSASTFRAMLRFIYTDELPIKPNNKIWFTARACKEKYTARRRAAMAVDLLAAADRYDLVRLGLMCQKILDESSDVIPAFRIDRGRHKCQQFENSCIDCVSSGTPKGSTRGPITEVSSPNIITHLEQLLASEQGSDLTFLVEEKKISAHRLIIAARSPVLHEAVVVSTVANKDDRQLVPIDGIKAHVFKFVLHFIYTDELPPMDNLLLVAAGNMVMVASDMLAAACRFSFERMKSMCENLLARSISKQNMLSTLKLARCYHCLELEDYCVEFISLPLNAKDVMNSISLA